MGVIEADYRYYRCPTVELGGRLAAALCLFLHTLFAIAAAVVVTMTTSFELATPNVMLTVIGVLGLTISYRAASATPHAITRLIRYQVPPCRTLRTFGERAIAEWKRLGQELPEVMAEKKMALDLGEGFSVALKHHFRGEPGLYYEDLYDLVCPLQPS
ncbi:MAG: hypothetical protein NXY57DRAFT_12972 [Lentinula lateritia]|nr:MAG: hypothetical protein NXY57DRAFT_12972 [Lentinula lateritia]